MNDYIAAESERVAAQILDFVESNRPKQGADTIFTTPGAGVMICRRTGIPEIPLLAQVDGFRVVYIHGSPCWYIGSMMSSDFLAIGNTSKNKSS